MITIDGRPLEASAGTLLEACRAAGVEVPTLCHDDRVSRGGHCRACLVELDGRVVPACTTPVRPGAHVGTHTPRLEAYRRDLAELVLAESSPRGRARAVCEAAGADGSRYPKLPRDDRHDASDPYLRLDLDACIKCRLCVRACGEIQGQFVYAFRGRGADARLTVGPAGLRLDETDCVSCGACASVCPSDAVTDVDRQRALVLPPTRTVRTTCAYCGVGCQLEVHATDDTIVQIEGARSASVNHGHLCVKGRYAHGFARHRDRLTTPLVRRGGRLEPASWDEALGIVAEAFTRLRGRVAGLSSSRCTNEENYLLQKWMRAGLGTNHVDCCARVCHAPTAAGMRRVVGTGAATSSLADLERADVILVSGSNATEAHPIVGARIKQAVLAGARLVVIDPRRTELAALADVHLQLRPGTNVVLLDALLAVLIEEDLVDHAFLGARTRGLEALSAHVATYAPERTARLTGVPAEQVRRVARLWGKARRPLQVHGLGITEHYQGSESVMLLCDLSLLVGGVGRPGAGINPLRGQNNVQGAADMGCQPDLLTGYGALDDAAVRARFEAVWGRPVPTTPGWTLPRMYEAARRGELSALFILGEDVVQTDPSTQLDEALGALELLVVQEIFLSETAKRAHVVLPGASFLEKDGTFTNGERRVQRVRRVLSPPGEARPDWQILLELMARTGCPQPFAGPSEVMDEIGRLAPAFAGISFARLEGDGLQWPVPAPGHPGTPILHETSFPGGRAELACVAFAPSPVLGQDDAAFPLRLVTGRVLEHYNCGTMTRRTDNVLLVDHDALELHPDDAAALGVAEGERVRVVSPYGQADAVARVTGRVQPGTVFLTFHFPETRTNQLVSDVTDRLADCPEYKLTPVRIERLQE